ncbi:hypothetical protein GCK72_026138 [Caenorhabditis remanei]|uniref:Protein kinase domain-containing protein n=1 Tax=Caenorhabditis remanei TaxID=31234 RepID=A0A6A5G415_CAERE|nr:hypothetical protein GCK72_026138 [Caenorhabditis remanei]KAF1749670.1 hypothetical protein GCK72_026138 [Caenorhabditis remanei]
MFAKLSHCLLQRIGSGSFGDVSMVSLPGNSQLVAMKKVRRTEKVTFEQIDNEYNIHRFLTENDGHPNLVTLLARGDGKRSTYMYMEYVEGGTVSSNMPKSGYPASTAQRLFKQLINGIEYVHKKGFVHRDIKPDNLLLSSNGVLKICDFGFACSFRDEAGKELKLDERVGTEEYAAPEVSTEDEFDGQPTDWWSCGVTLFYMTIGSAPWKSAHWSDPAYNDWRNTNWSARENWRSLEPRVRDLLCKILVENPELRANLKGIQSHQWFTANQDELANSSAQPTIECDRQDESRNNLNADTDSTGSVLFLREVEKSSSVVFLKTVKQSGSIIYVKMVNAETAQSLLPINLSENLEKKTARKGLKRKIIEYGDKDVDSKQRNIA